MNNKETEPICPNCTSLMIRSFGYVDGDEVHHHCNKCHHEWIEKIIKLSPMKKFLNSMFTTPGMDDMAEHYAFTMAWIFTLIGIGMLLFATFYKLFI